jgi:hypothetical protein
MGEGCLKISLIDPQYPKVSSGILLFVKKQNFCLLGGKKVKNSDISL